VRTLPTRTLAEFVFTLTGLLLRARKELSVFYTLWLILILYVKKRWLREIKLAV
jgi:hypothetical protein